MLVDLDNINLVLLDNKVEVVELVKQVLMDVYQLLALLEMVVRDHPSHLYSDRHPNLFTDRLTEFTLVVVEEWEIMLEQVELVVEVMEVVVVEQQEQLTLVGAVEMVLVVVQE
tara:strand:- start:70 stop:408 length:339 start_codon:yes stop_codon:yes gene_type:complete